MTISIKKFKLTKIGKTTNPNILSQSMISKKKINFLIGKDPKKFLMLLLNISLSDSTMLKISQLSKPPSSSMAHLKAFINSEMKMDLIFISMIKWLGSIKMVKLKSGKIKILLWINLTSKTLQNSVKSIWLDKSLELSNFIPLSRTSNP